VRLALKLALGGAVLAAAAAAALRVGSARTQQTFESLVARLDDAPPAQAAVVDFGELAALPAPVARYFRHVLREGQPMIRHARLEQEGVLRTGMEEDRWMSFTAVQVVVPGAPGFVWNATTRVAPFLHVRVLDSYVAGIGSGQVRLLSAITVGEDADNPQINSGALHRYLAEAVWTPTALLPHAGVRWAAIDERRALATLSDRGTTVSLEFRFNEAGEVSGIYSPGRWGQFDGGYRQVPWEGHFRDYVERDGMRVPAEGEVGWHRTGEWRAVWCGRLVAAVYAN
jgi:hypothetical protein